MNVGCQLKSTSPFSSLATGYTSSTSPTGRYSRGVSNESLSIRIHGSHLSQRDLESDRVERGGISSELASLTSFDPEMMKTHHHSVDSDSHDHVPKLKGEKKGTGEGRKVGSRLIAPEEGREQVSTCSKEKEILLTRHPTGPPVASADPDPTKRPVPMVPPSAIMAREDEVESLEGQLLRPSSFEREKSSDSPRCLCFKFLLTVSSSGRSTGRGKGTKRKAR